MSRLVICLVLLAAPVLGRHEKYEGHQVYRINGPAKEMVALETNLDILSAVAVDTSSLDELQALVRLSPEEQQKWLENFEENGISYNIIIDNLADVLREEDSSISQSRLAANRPDFFSEKMDAVVKGKDSSSSSSSSESSSSESSSSSSSSESSSSESSSSSSSESSSSESSSSSSSSESSDSSSSSESPSSESKSKEESSDENGSENSSSEKDSKESKSNEKDSKESESNEKVSKESESNEQGSKESESNEKGSKESESNEIGSKESESKEKDSKESESNEKGSHESESDEKVSKESESNEKDSKESESNEKGSKESESNEKESQESVSNEHSESEQDSSSKEDSDGWSINWDTYYRHHEINELLDELGKKYSKLVTVINAAHTYQGRQIKYVRISTTRFEDLRKRLIVISAGVHGREWMTTSVALYIINQLVVDIVDSDLVEKLDWVIIPLSNPDGYEWSIHVDRIWRKNRSQNHAGSFICPGVDVDRNFPHFWGTVSTVSSPCSPGYEGPASFSEPESRLLRDIIALNQRTALHISLQHNRANMVLYSWAHDGTLPPNGLSLHLAGIRIARAIGDAYIVGNAGVVLSLPTGTSLDWTRANGVLHTYIVELPSVRGVLIPFLAPPTAIKEVSAKTWAGIVEAGHHILSIY